MGGQSQLYWARKYKKCPTNTNKNNNGGSNGSLSVSFKGWENKEVYHPVYFIQDSGSGNSILAGVSDTVFQRRTAAAEMNDSRHVEGQNVAIIKKRKQ